MFLPVSCSILLAILSVTLADVKIPLDGSDWNLCSEDGSFYDTPAVVPGGVYTDLIRKGHLDDPYYRDNDQEYKWVGRTDWIYSKNFTVDSSFLVHSNIDLLCGGLDTVADVYINDMLVGQSDNMFVRYVFPVKHTLKAGSNHIEVKFTSPVNYASDARVAYPYDVTPDCPTEAQRGECHPNFIRKEQCSFSWDWGPSFPNVGIWRNITLEAYNALAIRYITARTDNKGTETWNVSGSVFLDVDESYTDSVTLNVKVASVTYSSETLVVGGKVDYSLTLQSSEIKLWWPNEYGEQALYDLMVSVTSKAGEEDNKKTRIGFRTVELIQEPVNGSEGLSFYFRINGVPIFMKGSNWIPADSFQERITTDYLHKLLLSAKHAHMNMLRVWGGGVYESEAFYELADELGIMIWQDFMFACALYPTNTQFLNTVTQEVTHQVRRLQRHPSIAIWAGNNENEGAVHKTDKQYYSDYVQLYVDTVRAIVLQEDTSRPFVTSSPSNGVETEKEGWVASNPQSEYYGDVHHYDYFSDSWDWSIYPRPRFASEFGFQSWCSMEAVEAVSIESDLAWDSDFANHRNHHPNGNAEMRNEWLKHFDEPSVNATQKEQFDYFIYLTQINQAMGIRTEAELYRRLQGRIMDGRGHTMGSLYWQLNDIWQAPTWASIEYGGKWKMLHYYAQNFYNQTLLSPVMEGNKFVVYYVDDHIQSKLENHAKESNNGVQEPESVKEPGVKESENHVKELDNGGKEPDNGVQEPDNHVQEPESGKESYNRVEEQTNLLRNPKEEEDHVLRFEPAKQSSTLSQSQSQHLIRKARSVEMPTLYIQMFSFAQIDYPKKTFTKSFSKPSEPSTVIFEEDLDVLLNQSNCTRDTCFLVVSLDLDLANPGPSNFLLFSYFKNVTEKGLKAANVEISAVKVLEIEDSDFDGGNIYEVDVKTDAVALFVWLEATGIAGRFSDNGFVMTGTHQKVLFYSWEKVPVESVRASLKVRSLMDMYQ